MRRITAWCLSAALLLGGLSGCGTARQSIAQTQAAVSWSDMQPTDSVDLEYAECFSVDHYDGGYSLITVKDDARYLVVRKTRPCRTVWTQISWCCSSRWTAFIWSPRVSWISSLHWMRWTVLHCPAPGRTAGTSTKPSRRWRTARSPMRASTARRITRPSTPLTAIWPLRIP